MLYRDTLSIGLTLALVSSAAGAQTNRPLIHEGDTIVGMGVMEDAATLVINDPGTWIAEVDTDFPTNSQDGVLLRNGLVTLREGVPLPQPPNSIHNEFVDISLAENGELGLLMTYVTGGVSRSGVFWNLVPLVSTGDPFPQHPSVSGLVWNTLLHAKMNDNRQFLVQGELSLPGSNLNKRTTLVRYQTNDQGQVIGLELLATEGEPIAALGGDQLNLMPTNLGATAQNERGDFLCVVDGEVGEPAILLNMRTVLAQVGLPSPVKGLDWKYLDRVPRTSINDFGDYVFTGRTEDPDGEPEASLYTIIKNGEVFAQEGDVIGSFSAEPMGDGSVTPVLIANTGDVFWHWENPAQTESAFMRNHEPIVQANATHVGANLVQGIPERQDSFDVSPDGRFWIGEVTVENFGETILLVDFGLVVPIPGCQANPGRLSLADGLALPGDSLTLAMDNGQAAGVRPILFFSTAPSVPDSPCGTATPFGELLIDLGSRFGRVLLPTWDGANASSVQLPIPNDVALINAELFVQGMFVDIDRTPAEDFRATNGLRIQIGAP